MQEGAWIYPLEKEAFHLCPLKLFFSSNTLITKTVSERYSVPVESRRCVLCCMLLNVFTAFLGSSVGNVLWLFTGLLQQLLVEIKENLLP